MSGRNRAPAALDGRVLDEIYEVIESRRGADPDQSRTANLLGQGTHRIAQKVGEEAVEALIEGVAGEPDALAAESADLLYHLLVLWAARGLPPQAVWAELDARRGASAGKPPRPRQG